MNAFVWILAGIFVVNLFIAGWLITLELVDRSHRHKASREIDALERSLAMPSAGKAVLSAHGLRDTHRAVAVGDQVGALSHARAGRRPRISRLVGKASIGVALASTVLWVAVAVPDLGTQPTTTTAYGGVDLSVPPTWESPSDREAPGVEVPSPRAGPSRAVGVSPGVPTDPPETNTNTNTTFEGETVPGSVAARPRSSTAISLAWTAVPGAIAYTIDRSEETQDPDWVTITKVEAVTTYTDVGLAAGTTYFYRVAARTEEGAAPPSDVISATTLIAPPAATHLIAIQTGITVTLTWVDVAQETAYRIERDHSESGWITIGTTGQDVTAYTDASLTPGDMYRYRIVATNAGGDSDASNVVPVKIDIPEVATPPDDPTSPGADDSKPKKPPTNAEGSAVTEDTPVDEGEPVTDAAPVTEEDH